ncbi:MAG TPA: nitrate ABC transporter permease, partial [Ktedonobacter sp.]|nr:nitrate ABC transporter permease [Ktedonobacter sp.]
MKLRWLAGFGPAFVLGVTIVALWELYVRSGQISSQVLPTPTAIVQALIDHWDVISVNTLQTLLETVLGMAAATIFGLSLAITLEISQWSRRAVYPLLVISQTIPIIALAPLLLIWFGIDLGPKVFVVALYCFFPIAVACADGLASAEPEMIN